MKKIITAFITSLLIAPITALLGGWYFMLAVDIAHREWIHNLPTIGYWWAVLIVFLMAGVFSARNTSGGDK